LVVSAFRGNADILFYAKKRRGDFTIHCLSDTH